MVPYLRHPPPKPFFSYRRILPGLVVLGAVSVLSLLSSGGRAYGSDEQDALRQEPSPEDAALIRSLEGKIHELQNPQANPHVGPSSMEITEAEVNAYFKHRGSELIIDAISDVRFSFLPGRVKGSAVANFTELKKTQQEKKEGLFSGWFIGWIEGERKVEFSLTLESDQGKVMVKIESVTIEGVNLPLFLVDFMLNRFLDKQNDLSLDDPMPLPFRIRKVTAESERLVLERDLAASVPATQ